LNILLHPFAVAKSKAIANPGCGVAQLRLSKRSAGPDALKYEQGHANAGGECHDRFLAKAIYPRILFVEINR
jgi:hypothetical protein